ncbi:MAG: hypothetical protein ACI9WC_001892 [Arenicella sp.]|jgi:hypothetical protein
MLFCIIIIKKWIEGVMMLKIKLAFQHWLKVSGLVFFVTCLLSAPISSQAQSQNARVLPPIISLLLDSDDCVRPINVGSTVFDTLEPQCLSVDVGYFAGYFTFNHEGGPIHIDLLSDFPNSYDAYLILRHGEGRGGDQAAPVDAYGHEDAFSSQIRISSLAAGRYTIEASSWEFASVGSYNLSVYGNKVTANATGILNDTGIVFSGNETDGNNDSPEPTIDQCIASIQGGDNQFARQDCSFGRDADDFVGDGDSRNNADLNSDYNDGDGAGGFSFLKVSSAGAPMRTEDTLAHACVKDNVTGLMWEVKTDDSGLHDKDDSYTWYNTNTAQNGGAEGTQNGGSCFSGVSCDTNGFVTAVNVAGLCTYNDWRMPTVTELQGLLNYQKIDFSNPLIDTTFFPNTKPTFFWSASPIAINSIGAWGVFFLNGDVFDDGRSFERSVRLVRGGQ